MKRVMVKVVSNNQNTFVRGRQILDAVFVSNEAISSRKQSSSAGLVCKLDIEKTYDHVNWCFLLSVLEKMGFGPKWRKWIFFLHFNCKNDSFSQWHSYRVLLNV